MHRIRLVASTFIAIAAVLSSGWPGLATQAGPVHANAGDATPERSQNDCWPQAPAAATYPDLGHVTALAFDGTVAWVGTANGLLVRLDTTTSEQAQFPYPVTGVAIRGIVRSARGFLWTATEGGGLGRLDPMRQPGPGGQAWQTFAPSNSDFPSNNVRAVALDPTEHVWAATDSGAAYLDGDRWIAYDTRNSGLPSDNVTAILAADGTWVGTDAGLARLADGQWKIVQTGNSDLPDDRVTALARDHQANLWIGTESGAFETPGPAWRTYAQSRYDVVGTRWTQFPEATGPVRGLALDAADRVWVNWGDRVERLSSCDSISYDAAALGLGQSSVEAVAVDSLGRLWAGGEGGLARLADRGERAEWTPTEITQPVQALAVDGERVLAALADGAVSEMNTATLERRTSAGPGGEASGAAVDPQGRLWIGTWGQGIAMRDGDDWRRFTRANASLPSDFVSGIAFAPDGTVWAATASGLAALNPAAKSWRTVKSGRILAVAAAADGRVAFGSYGDGMSLYDGKIWTAFNSANSALPSDYVQAVAFDAKHRLWAGTQGGGVACFDGNAWTAYAAGPGGPVSDFTNALAVDPTGHVWAGASASTGADGLAEFDGCIWTHYPGATNNLPGGITSLTADANGTLWVGGETGLFTLQPAPTPVSRPAAAQSVRHSIPTRATAPQTTMSQSQPDTDRWISHTVGRSAHAFAFSEDFAWEGTLGGGLLRWRLSDGSFTRFSYPQDGLPSNRIVYVAVDPEGRVWAATQDRGVAVYDGRHWTTYDTRNSGLSHDDVNGIAFDSKGRTWLATMGGGVCVFDPGKGSGPGSEQWTVYQKDAGLAGDQVWYVAVDAQDRVWAGTIGGLSVFDPDSETSWTTFPNTQNVHCIAFDAQGRTWFGDGSGLNRVDGQTVTPIRTGEYQPWTKDVYAIRFDPLGVAWLGCGTGIWRYDGETFSHIATSSTNLSGNQVYAVGLDLQGNVWFGTDGEDGAARMTPTPESGMPGAAWRTFHTSTGPNPVTNSIRRLFVDRQGRLWAGGVGGLSVYDGRAWIGYTPENSGLVADDVQSITQGPDGRMWVGTGSGISVFDGKERWQTIASGDGTSGLLDNTVNVIRFDAQGRAWIGSRGGLSMFDPRQQRGPSWQTYTEANTGIDLRDVRDLAVDRQGRVWVVTTISDVYVLSGDRQWTTITREEYGLQSFSLESIGVDPSGRVWLGSFDGLTVFDPGPSGGKWTVMQPFPKDSGSATVFDIAFDPQGQAWIGCYGGLARETGAGWIDYTREDAPLPDDSVSAVAVDPRGHVWLGSSSYGLAELIPAEKRFPVRATATTTPPIPTAIAPATLVATPSAPPPTSLATPTAVTISSFNSR